MRDISKVVKMIEEEPLYKNSAHNVHTNSIVTSYLQNICSSISGSKEDIINKIYKYIKSTVNDRKEYYEYFYGESEEFDRKELSYRTAFAALIKKESISVGFCEAMKIMLDIFEIDNHTIIYTMDNKTFNYALVVDVNGRKKVLDPWLEQVCEKNIWSYDEITKNNIYILPDDSSFLEGVELNGFGKSAGQYLEKSAKNKKKGIENIEEIFE